MSSTVDDDDNNPGYLNATDKSSDLDAVMVLELTDEIKNNQMVTSFFSTFNSKSVIVQLNHKYGR